jgi:hypothetical protein
MVIVDRWKWKRIVKWAVGLPVLLALIGAGGFWAYFRYDERPKPQTEFGGLKLGATEADVKFIRG